MGFNDEPMIKQKTYSENEYKAKKEKTFKVARRNIIMGEVSFIAGVNIFVPKYPPLSWKFSGVNVIFTSMK